MIWVPLRWVILTYEEGGVWDWIEAAGTWFNHPKLCKGKCCCVRGISGCLWGLMGASRAKTCDLWSLEMSGSLMKRGGHRYELTPLHHCLNCPKSCWGKYGCVGVFCAVSWLWMASQGPQMCDLGYLEMIEKSLWGGIGIGWIELPQHDFNHPEPCFGKCGCLRSILSYFLVLIGAPRAPDGWYGVS